EYAPYRIIVELVGGVVLGNALSMLAKDGVCVSIAASAGATTTIDISHFYAAGRTSLYGFLLFNELGKEPASEGLARLAALVSEGRLKTQVTVEEPWSKVGEVICDFLDRKISGKAVLRVE
ncbi:zinc-binding dehydrogenase, partial [bacterium]|nr:zinc-binding dehydrogenase [bacterium]